MPSMIRKIVVFCFMTIGILLIYGPVCMELTARCRMQQEIDAFVDASYRQDMDELIDKMRAYNQSIYEIRDEVLTAEGYDSIPACLPEVTDSAVGYIEIPSIDIKMPLYISATEKNLDRGAAVMDHTSLPVGGVNTNCVIAGHRGWNKGRYFKDIEEIMPGDQVIITNAREQLNYVVFDMEVIEPSDIGKLSIRPGEDMVTLLTCHPYLGHGRYRYLVYCKRDTGESIEGAAEYEDPLVETKASVPYEKGLISSSAGRITLENILRIIAAFGLPIWAVMQVLQGSSKKKG